MRNPWLQALAPNGSEPWDLKSQAEPIKLNIATPAGLEWTGVRLRRDLLRWREHSQEVPRPTATEQTLRLYGESETTDSLVPRAAVVALLHHGAAYVGPR